MFADTYPVRYKDFIARSLVNAKCHWQGLGTGVSSPVALGRLRFFWAAGKSLGSDVWLLSACPPLPSLLSVHQLQGLGPEHIGCSLALIQRQAGSLWLWDLALFSFLCSEKSFILALFCGCWGLGEPWGDLAIGQLSKLCWEIWRGVTSLCLISTYILLSLPKQVFTVANPTA